jgi:diacylglycerol kinase family enzyme
VTPIAPVALVVNPAATRSDRTTRAQVARALAPLGLEWSLVTSGPGDAARLARDVAGQGAAVVVSLGGDGVAGEVAGALAGGPVAMAPLPGGNANVFSRGLGWPNSARAALPLLAAGLRDRRLREAALGLLRIGGPDGGERVFAVNAGVGLDAATVEWIEARPRTKRRLRQAGFVLGAGIAALRTGRAPHLRAVVDGGEVVLARAVLTACGTPYTYLGRRPLELVPGAGYDGRLAWVGITRLHPAELAGLGLRAVRGRDLPIGSATLAGGPIVRELVIESDVPAPVQADGEPLGRHLELRVSRGPVLRAVEPRPG